MTVSRTIALLASLIASTSAHGHVNGIVAAGTYYTGYRPSFAFENPKPTVIGWTTDNLSNGFISPGNYTEPDIICHYAGSPGGTSARVSAGDTVELQWTPWPSSHHGPVLDYLAKCPGKCEDVDKSMLRFFKIDEGGLINSSSVPRVWGSDQLIANNHSWTVRIPSDIQAGNYVLRHEIIALHGAGEVGGAQNYPQCFNLEVVGAGTQQPEGVLGTELYRKDDTGIVVWIYTSIESYTIPGPTVYQAAVRETGTSATVGATTTVAAATTAFEMGKSVSFEYAPTTSVEETTPCTKELTYTSQVTVVSQVTVTTTVTPTLTSSVAAIAASSSTECSGGIDRPSKPLPPGVKMEDLLEWVAIMLKKSWDEQGKERVHQRDLRKFAAAMF